MAGQVLDPDSYWKRPQGPSQKAHWVDPEPDVRGMLSADRIQFYVKEVGLIEPFNEENLKPASYSLTLGPLYQTNGKFKHLTERNPTLVIPRNSIVFVAMAEVLRLPHYLAARFNLSIELVYKGLLLGTGPQVDPGFQGVLSCPLHNISSDPIRIKLGTHIATIDFIKTTGIGETTTSVLSGIDEEAVLYKRKEEIEGKLGYSHRFFPSGKRWLQPILDYSSGGAKISSSVRELEKTVSRANWLSIGTAIAAAALIVTLAALVLSGLAMYNGVQASVTELRQRIDQVEITSSSNQVPPSIPEPSETPSTSTPSP